MNRKPFLVAFVELLTTYWPRPRLTERRWLRALLPTPGNVLFTLLVVALLFWAQSVGALPLGRPQAAPASSTSTIAYQGRLANANNQPLTGNYGMEFRLYDVSSGGTPLWSETWTGSNSVSVSDGLFNIMLGSLNPIPQSVITDHGSLWLGITVGSDTEMAPRVQLGSVPFAVQALTVPDGSVTAQKLALRARQMSRGIRADNTVPIESTENIGSISYGMDAANIPGVDGVSITTSGGDILILASVLASSANPRTYVVYAIMDNSVICRSVRPIDSSVGTSLISCLVQDVAAGTHTVLLKHSVGAGEAGSDIYLRDRILNVIEVGK